MKIFGLEIKRSKKKLSNDLRPVSNQDRKIPADKKPRILKLKRINSPVLSFKPRSGTNQFEQPEYDLVETGRVADTESLVERAFEKKEGLMFKEGWEFVGKNPKTVQYIKERLSQMDEVTNYPHRLLFEEIGSDLVRQHNAYLVKVRNKKASGGKVRKLFGQKRSIEPVAGYFLMPASTVEIKRTQSGKVVQYRQKVRVSGKIKEFPAENVVHFYSNRKQGFMIGTPPLIPVIDDIRALRRIEENVEMLIYQHLFPLYHYKVGDIKAPARTYPDGTSEVDAVKQEVEYLPAEGAIVTSERHSIEAIGAESKALRAETYLKHFKQRVFSGLGVSPVDLGEGDTSNRSTAETLSRNLVDGVKRYQQIFAKFVNQYIIRELLLESIFDDPLSEENIVKIKFKEIDFDSKIKAENHAMNAFTNHALTHAELRQAMGMEPMTDEEWEDAYWKKIQEPQSLIAAVDEAYLASSAVARHPSTDIEQEDIDQARQQRAKEDKEGADTSASSQKRGPKKKKKSSGERAAGASDQPENQHGKKTGPEKRKSFLMADLRQPSNKLAALYQELLNEIKAALGGDTQTVEWYEAVFDITRKQMLDYMQRRARLQFLQGYRNVGLEPEAATINEALAILASRIDRLISRLLNQLLDVVKQTVASNLSLSKKQISIVSAFDSLEYRVDAIFTTENQKAFNFGVAWGCRVKDTACQIKNVGNNVCDLCKSANGPIDLEDLAPADVPPLHPSCKCVVTPA